MTIDKLELLPPPPNPLGKQIDPEFRSIVPRAYGDQTTSGLKATVRRGLNSGPEFRFDLRSDFQPPASATPAKSSRHAAAGPRNKDGARHRCSVCACRMACDRHVLLLAR